jgi:uncharacterized protein YdaU (DUF1376 family)
MAKDPAVLLYTSDFLSGTFSMSNEEVGMYIRLLCLQHQKGKLTEKDMLSICKTYVQDVYEKFEFKDGFYINKRMYEEAEKRIKYTESRRNNAKPKHMKEHMPKHMENENEDVNKDDNINVLVYPNSEFEKIWKGWIEYKKSEHKEKFKSPKTEQTAINKLIELSNGDSECAAKIINHSIANRYKGLFALSQNKSNFNQPKTKMNQYAEWYSKLTANLGGEENTKVSGFID